MKQIEVTILGQGYLLACPEDGEAQLASAVADVDREMTAIRDAGKVKARERIAVLAALNLAYQLAEVRTHQPAADSAGGDSAEDPPALRGVDLQALIRRIDQSLDDDGHLI